MLPAKLGILGMGILVLAMIVQGCTGNCPTCQGTGSVATGSTGATGTTGTTPGPGSADGTVEMK
jgi:hypothetical protein